MEIILRSHVHVENVYVRIPLYRNIFPYFDKPHKFKLEDELYLVLEHN